MDYEIITLETEKDLRKIPRRTEKIIIISTQKETLARRAVEKYNVDAVCDLETTGGRDHTHYRRSGATQVLFNILFDNKCGYLINFTRILAVEGYKRAKLLGRIMQNIKIAQREKKSVPIYIVNFSEDEFEKRNQSDLKAFGRVLGIKKPLLLSDLLKRKEEKRGLIRKGVRLLNS